MRGRGTVLLLASLVFGSLALGGDAAKGMQGTWKATKGKLTWIMAFKGNNFTVNMTDGEVTKGPIKGTFKVDTSKTPHQIDMKIVDASGDSDHEKYVGKVSHGIIKLEGDSLTWCANEPGREGRPAEFSPKAPEGKGYLLITLKRQAK